MTNSNNGATCLPFFASCWWVAEYPAGTTGWLWCSWWPCLALWVSTQKDIYESSLSLKSVCFALVKQFQKGEIADPHRPTRLQNCLFPKFLSIPYKGSQPSHHHPPSAYPSVSFGCFLLCVLTNTLSIVEGQAPVSCAFYFFLLPQKSTSGLSACCGVWYLPPLPVESSFFGFQWRLKTTGSPESFQILVAGWVCWGT